MTIEVVAVTDASGKVVNAAMLAAAEEVHRQLRPQLPADYAARMAEIFANGAEMAVAVVEGRVAGITVFRILAKTMSGREIYCDDLVTDQTRRSAGVGGALLAYLDGVGKERKCEGLALSSGTQRQEAHRFYFRERMTITAFAFTRKL
jgi:GNAT superfamily N-acetyltransferase